MSKCGNCSGVVYEVGSNGLCSNCLNLYRVNVLGIGGNK